MANFSYNGVLSSFSYEVINFLVIPHLECSPTANTIISPVPSNIFDPLNKNALTFSF